MFGILRFILACIVMLNHSPFNSFPFDLSVSAVVIFYIISGYTMGIKYKRYQKECSRPMRLFWIDRFLRVFPLYLFFVFGAIIAMAVLNPDSKDLSFSNIIQNITLIPVNYYMFTDMNNIGPTYVFVPTAFSLALEEQFYLLMPLILFNSKISRAVIVLSGLFLSFCAFFIWYNYPLLRPILNSDFDFKLWSDFFIYRLLPGTIIIFMLGVHLDKVSLLAKSTSQNIFFLYLILFFTCSIMLLLRSGRFFDVSMGVLIGAPLVDYLKNQKRNKLDDALGNLSYGIFLAHSLYYIYIQRFIVHYNLEIDREVFNLIEVVLTLITAAVCFKYIEKPAHEIRLKVVNKIIKKYPKLA